MEKYWIAILINLLLISCGDIQKYNEELRVCHDSKLFIQNEQLCETQSQFQQDHSFDLLPMKKLLLRTPVTFDQDQNDQGLHHFMQMSIPNSLMQV